MAEVALIQFVLQIGLGLVQAPHGQVQLLQQFCVFLVNGKVIGLRGKAADAAEALAHGHVHPDGRVGPAAAHGLQHVLNRSRT